MKRRKGFMAILILLLVAIGVSGYSYQSARTPEYALDQLMEGVKDHDAQKVQRYADVSAIITTSYDTGTAILARDIERLHAAYPQDWFFCHDTAFMKSYIADRRANDLVFIHRSMEFFLTPTIAPIGESDEQAKWMVGEAEKFTQHYSAKLENVERKGDWAEATFIVTGDDSDYGRLVPQMTVKVELAQQDDGHFQVTHITNGEEIFDPIVKGVEDYWTLQGWQ